MILKNINKDSLFSEIKKEFDLIRDLEIYFKINYPILFSFKSKHKRYIAYVTKYKPIRGVLDILITESSDEQVFNFMEFKETIYDIYTKDIFQVMEINIKRDRKKKQSEYEIKRFNKSNKECLIDDLPNKDFKLNKIFPNEIEIDDIKQNVEHRLKMQDIQQILDYEIIESSINNINVKSSHYNHLLEVYSKKVILNEKVENKRNSDFKENNTVRYIEPIISFYEEPKRIVYNSIKQGRW